MRSSQKQKLDTLFGKNDLNLLLIVVMNIVMEHNLIRYLMRKNRCDIDTRYFISIGYVSIFRDDVGCVVTMVDM